MVSVHRSKEIAERALEKAKSKSEPPVWLKDAPNVVGHPDEADIDVLKHQISELF